MGTKEILKVSGYQTITNPVLPLTLIPIMNALRAPYSGPSRKLVIALDIGTTFSGAAYAFLDPGEVPEIRPVTRQAPPLIPDLVIRGNKENTGTSTVRMLGPQKSPLYFITMMRAFSVVSRTGLISRIPMDCSG